MVILNATRRSSCEVLVSDWMWKEYRPVPSFYRGGNRPSEAAELRLEALLSGSTQAFLTN